MANSLIKICYEGETGSSDIKTFYQDEILYISLKDILVTLSRENRELDERHIVRSTAGIIKNQLEVLDEDEYLDTSTLEPNYGKDDEIFITQPGLYRVLSSDSSKAGKRFQKWLYHEVIPSLTKHGCYPPPLVPKGSALSQMAEILAQNSRALADAIVRQDQLEVEVKNVKSTLGNINERVSSIETQGLDFTHIVTVRDRLTHLKLDVDKQKEEQIVIWCENLNFRSTETRISCPSGERLNARFSSKIIDEATSLVTDATT